MKKLKGCFFYTNDLAKQRIFSYHNRVVFLVHPPLSRMPLYEERTGLGSLVLSLFLFQTPIYTNQYGSSIAKTACRKKQHAHIEKLFTIKILIRRKPAVIKKFNLLAHIQNFCAGFENT